MRFYYLSVFSLVLLVIFYGLALIVLWWTKGLKRKFSGPVVWVAVAAVLVAPVAEELWIAWNFGQLCRKDAGIVINKTVEVEGFYDATIGLLQIQKPLPEVTSKSFDQRGFKFYEMHMRDGRGGPGKVAHFEKVNGEWMGTVIDKPVARYHFFTDSGIDIGHKLAKQESKVLDSKSGQFIGEYRVYIRQAPWFYIGLDRPNMGCDGPDGGPYSKHKNSFLIYRDVLIPSKSVEVEEK